MLKALVFSFACLHSLCTTQAVLEKLLSEDQPEADLEQDCMNSFLGLDLNYLRVQAEAVQNSVRTHSENLVLAELVRATLAKKLCGITVIANDQVSGASNFCKMWLECIDKAASGSNLDEISAKLIALLRSCNQATQECRVEVDDYLHLLETTAISYGHNGMIVLEARLDQLNALAQALQAALECIKNDTCL